MSSPNPESVEATAASAAPSEDGTGGRAETSTGASDVPEEQRPEQQSLGACMCREAHWRCLILSLLMYSCLGAVAWCQLTTVTKISFKSSFTPPLTAPLSSPLRGLSGVGFGGHSMIYHDSPCSDGYIYIPLAFLVMLYVLYMVECWHCRARSELQRKADIDSVYERVLKMRQAQPCIWWKAISYHFVRRTRLVTRYRSGDANITTQVYHERVNTHLAEGEFDYSRCGVKDVSRDLKGLEAYAATRLRFTKCFSFTETGPENDYLNQRARFFSEVEGLDDYMEAREGMQLKNVEFRENVMVYVDPDKMPWYSSQAAFWLAAFLTLSWPLRVLSEYRTAFVHYRIEKLFGLEYNPETPSSQQNEQPIGNHTGCIIPRVDTLDSTEMEVHIRCNRQVIPSYSEAMLINTSTTESISLQDTDYTASSDCLLLDRCQTPLSYGALVTPDVCEQSTGPTQQERRQRRRTITSSCSSLFSCRGTLYLSHPSSDTSRFSLCRMYGSQRTLGFWRSRSSSLSEPWCEQSCQPSTSVSPPSYGDAHFFPVLIVQHSEGRGSESGHEVRGCCLRRDSGVETAL
ncbi:transmembrane protein 151B [Eucyclogobius newberryi]|uniref:transmembrane protein 151B n=1 Tax=Eucyclogobius newberryi TaxID=166745 RepID=UPI003B5B784F